MSAIPKPISRVLKTWAETGPTPPRLAWLEDQIVGERPDWVEAQELLAALVQALQDRYGQSVCESEYQALKGAMERAEQSWIDLEASRARLGERT